MMLIVPVDNAAGFAIHGSILAERPDIQSVAHSHSIYGKAFSILGRNIDMGTFGTFPYLL